MSQNIIAPFVKYRIFTPYFFETHLVSKLFPTFVLFLQNLVTLAHLPFLHMIYSHSYNIPDLLHEHQYPLIRILCWRITTNIAVKLHQYLFYDCVKTRNITLYKFETYFGKVRAKTVTEHNHGTPIHSGN